MSIQKEQKILTPALANKIEEKLVDWGDKENTAEAMQILKNKVGKTLDYMDMVVIRQFISDSDDIHSELESLAPENREDEEINF